MDTTTTPVFNLAELQKAGFVDSGIKFLTFPSLGKQQSTAYNLNVTHSSLRLFHAGNGEWFCMLPPNAPAYKPEALLP